MSEGPILMGLSSNSMSEIRAQIRQYIGNKMTMNAESFAMNSNITTGPAGGYHIEYDI